MLPLSDSGEPDYNYIEDYIRLKRSALLEKYQGWVKIRIAELGDTIDIPLLSEKDWQAFVIKDIADVYTQATTSTHRNVSTEKHHLSQL